MAYSDKDWEMVRSYYEAGLSLSEIISKESIPIKSKSQISKRAMKFGWKKTSEKKQLILDEIKAKQSLSEINKQKDTLKETDVIVHNELVNERLRLEQFFTSATMKNCSIMMKKIDADTDITEHRIVQETLSKARDTALGKTPETAVQINNNTAQTINPKLLSDSTIEEILNAK